MINAKELYNKKIKSVDEALKCIKDGDVIFAAQANAEPRLLLENLHKIREYGVRGVEMQNCLPLGSYEFINNPEYKDTIFTHGWYFTPDLRKAQRKGNATFTPQHGHIAVWKKLHSIEGRRIVLFCTCSPMDQHGYLSLSVSNFYERELIDKGAVVICEVNKNFPRTFGDNMVHISEIEAFVETDYPVPEVELVPYTDVDRKIGENIAELVEDGSTIQLGIGKIPNAVAVELRSRKHLGIHTEMITESMMQLIECGAVDNSRKTLLKGRTVGAFAFGNRKLYDYINDNPSILFKAGSWVNNPNVIGRNYKMISINTTLEVDLTGQCASESIGSMQYSGTGGQADTAIGAQMSEEGKSIIALHSTADITDAEGKRETISKIVPFLKNGSIVSLSRNDVDYVVTEYGTAWLRGLSVKDRVNALISIAHPDFRDMLKYEVRKNYIW